MTMKELKELCENEIEFKIIESEFLALEEIKPEKLELVDNEEEIDL